MGAGAEGHPTKKIFMSREKECYGRRGQKWTYPKEAQLNTKRPTIVLRVATQPNALWGGVLTFIGLNAVGAAMGLPAGLMLVSAAIGLVVVKVLDGRKSDPER